MGVGVTATFLFICFLICLFTFQKNTSRKRSQGLKFSQHPLTGNPLNVYDPDLLLTRGLSRRLLYRWIQCGPS
ncbi:hypothetical protein F5B18DRAFT_206522 [Nemania serpens]|nr:hypothetical protein F5B18DRAFT_206522 [Nemania serpens]